MKSKGKILSATDGSFSSLGNSSSRSYSFIIQTARLLIHLSPNASRHSAYKTLVYSQDQTSPRAHTAPPAVSGSRYITSVVPGSRNPRDTGAARALPTSAATTVWAVATGDTGKAKKPMSPEPRVALSAVSDEDGECG